MTHCELGSTISDPASRRRPRSLTLKVGWAGDSHPSCTNNLAIKKGRAEDPPCLASCLELLAIGHRKETEFGPPSGHPPGPLLKPSSRLASVRIVFLSQDWSAVLTSLMIWAVVSG
jgi:hypothetical protein